jgi:hypothetical protein
MLLPSDGRFPKTRSSNGSRQLWYDAPPIAVCRNPIGGWATVWPDVRHED